VLASITELLLLLLLLHRLLAASCLNMDVTNACVGMANGMLTVATMIEAGVVDYALVVNAEAIQVGWAPTTVWSLPVTACHCL
jgi:3-oxoacyl-[acyl-carrier-protein] synthase III